MKAQYNAHFLRERNQATVHPQLGMAYALCARQYRLITAGDLSVARPLFAQQAQGIRGRMGQRNAHSADMALPDPDDRPYVSRSGSKLAAALDAFGIDPAGLICADLGSNVGGFVDCLLGRGAKRVYAVDTGYGVLAYKLRIDPRVAVHERTNAMHVTLPEPVDLVTIDTGWTRQAHVLPNAVKMLKPGGRIITLIKPHYEARPDQVRGGVLNPETARSVLAETLECIRAAGLNVELVIESPVTGHKGNIEFLALLLPGNRSQGENPEQHRL